MNIPTNWYESFFNGVAVELWRHAIPSAQTEREADLILQLLELGPASPGGPEGPPFTTPAGSRGLEGPRDTTILDVPCGLGRLARVLDSRGYGVTGVDLSEESLAHARSVDSGIRWECRDMRDLPWRAAFDGAYCFGNSFGYLDDAGNEEFLRSVASTLKPGGRFVLETPMVAESALATVKERSWWKVGDIHLLAANRFDPPSGRLETEYTFVSSGHVEVRYGTHRMYTYRQLVDLFRTAGFSDVTTWTWNSARPVDGPGDAGIRLESYRAGAALLLLIGRVP
jgi:SAM-dependent methyltransferase